MTGRFNWFYLFLIVLGACGEKNAKPLFTLIENSGIVFTNTVENTKDFNIFIYRNFYNGGGVAIGDINNDSLADVFFTSNMGSNKLFINKGNWQFEDITDKAGFQQQHKWSTGVVMVDLNADGWLDIYVCNAGYQKGVGQQNDLYINNKNGTFTEQAKTWGLDDSSYTTHAAFLDYDLDGDLDCYLLNNSFIPVNTLNYANMRNLRAENWQVASFLKGGGDKLLRNDAGYFNDVSEEAGIYGSLIGFGLGVTVGDINADHYPDLYISNDFFERDYLYINQGNGKFKESLTECIEHTSLASMGADIADINNDGYPDIFTTDMLPDDEYRLKTTASFDNIDVYNLKVKQDFYYQFQQNTLQLNNKAGRFMDIAYYSGVSGSDWSWGGLIFDADNDGNSDLYVCNGIYHDVTNQDFIDFFANDVIQKMVLTGEKEQVNEIINKMPSEPVVNKFFRNEGNLKFSDAGNEWGITQPSFSNGAAYGDLDNDGDLDLIVSNVNQPCFVYKNESREQATSNYMGFKLKGKDSNSFAIGAKIEIFIDKQVISRELIPSRGFQSSVDYKIIAGTGKNTKTDSVIITWPGGIRKNYGSLAINKVHHFEYPAINAISYSQIAATTDPFFTLDSAQFDKHTEDNYIDFYFERNIPEMLSREGPKAVVGDINNDRLDDIYICGSVEKPGQLYVQTAAGFEKANPKFFELFKGYEDTDAAFADLDNDGDIDMLVASGGNVYQPGNSMLQTRFYRNDGKGNFRYDAFAIPQTQDNTSCLALHDIDNDGDIDFFAGSLNVSREYGSLPQSHLFINNGKAGFNALKPENMGGADRAGMIKDASWVDVNGDSKKELILTGLWIQPQVYEFNNGVLSLLNTGFNHMEGWWQTVESADLDQDGDMDLVLGNIGDNFYLRPNAKAPVKLFVKDFDNNQTIDCILTRTVDKKDMTVFMKRDLTDQLPSLKKQNLKHQDFAGKSIQQLFTPEQMSKCNIWNFNTGNSVIAWNEGHNKFTIQELPTYVQFSSVNAIHINDINKDGHADIVLAGNNFNFIPQLGRLDACFGSILLGDGKRNFTLVAPGQTGLLTRGMVRDIVAIQIGNNPCLLFLQNNDNPLLYRINNHQN